MSSSTFTTSLTPSPKLHQGDLIRWTDDDDVTEVFIGLVTSIVELGAVIIYSSHNQNYIGNVVSLSFDGWYILPPGSTVSITQ